MMTILTRGGWYRRKHGALACVTPAIGIVPGRHAHPPSPALSWPARGGMNGTPSSSSIARCRSGPPNAKPGASEPSRNTTRWQGITPGSGLACSAKPTNLALRGRPASVATWPVGRDRSARDPPDDVIHRTVERCRTVERRCAAG